VRTSDSKEIPSTAEGTASTERATPRLSPRASTASSTHVSRNIGPLCRHLFIRDNPVTDSREIIQKKDVILGARRRREMVKGEGKDNDIEF
jgi:hypothetical protein